MLKITEEMRESARKLLKAAGKLDRPDRDLLTAIVGGKRKQIDGRWWKEIHHYVIDQPKLDKLSRLADPERNDNPHERDLARTKLAGFKAKRPPGLHPEPPPLPKTWAEWVARRKPSSKSAKPKSGPVNTSQPSLAARQPSVNTTQVTPSKTGTVNTTKRRSADRHREPNRDRHSPGYMAEYMRKRRARLKGRSKA
jgi:hypothetical protein